jgi:hypothetical protein
MALRWELAENRWWFTDWYAEALTAQDRVA